MAKRKGRKQNSAEAAKTSAENKGPRAATKRKLAHTADVGPKRGRGKEQTMNAVPQGVPDTISLIGPHADADTSQMASAFGLLTEKHKSQAREMESLRQEIDSLRAQQTAVPTTPTADIPPDGATNDSHMASAFAALQEQHEEQSREILKLRQEMEQLKAQQSISVNQNPIQSGVLTDGQNEANNIPVSFQHSPNEVPRYSPGMAAGSNATPKMKLDIWGHKYIELHDLLYPNIKPSYGMSMRDQDSQHQILLTPKNRRLLSEVEWGMAFDIFIAVYTQKFPQQLSALLTYSAHVKDLMKFKTNWRYYDEEYRRSREFNPHSWLVVRQDLELRAFRTNYHPDGYSYTASYEKSSVGRSIPKGYCFAYHKRGQRCLSKDCKYKHQCPKCHDNHPLYLACHKGSPSNNTDQTILHDGPK